MLESRVGGVGRAGAEREVVIQMSGADIGCCLGDDLGSLHRLAAPEGSAILNHYFRLEFHGGDKIGTHDGGLDSLCIGRVGGVFIAGRKSEVVGGWGGSVYVPLPISDLVGERPFSMRSLANVEEDRCLTILITSVEVRHFARCVEKTTP
jgi:hypothetical protein